MPEPLGLLLSDDLIDTSRVTATARSLGLTVRTARTQSALEALASQAAPSCVLVDLANPGLDLPALLAKLRTACEAMPRVVAYGSHVNVESLKAARSAGCDVVLPRSAFVEQLPTDLAGWLAGPTAP
jgi:CheY-like chemotaxis protein